MGARVKEGTARQFGGGLVLDQATGRFVQVVGRTAQILQGSVINGAATVFAQPRATGNNRPRAARLYSGSFTSALGHSAWNARPYSFSGSAVPAPDYGNAQFTLTVGGPFWIPGWFTQGPTIRASYSRGVQHTADTRSALVS